MCTVVNNGNVNMMVVPTPVMTPETYVHICTATEQILATIVTPVTRDLISICN